jgi:Flp pilus assembly protein protease CpaA
VTTAAIAVTSAGLGWAAYSDLRKRAVAFWLLGLVSLMATFATTLQGLDVLAFHALIAACCVVTMLMLRAVSGGGVGAGDVIIVWPIALLLGAHAPIGLTVGLTAVLLAHLWGVDDVPAIPLLVIGAAIGLLLPSNPWLAVLHA